MTERLYDVEEAAQRLSIAVPTLYKWVREHRVPVIRLSSRALRFDPRQLERFLQSNSVEVRTAR